jgi:hypothetical protein
MLNTEDLQILGAVIQNPFASTVRHLGFPHPWHKKIVTFLKKMGIVCINST